MQLRGYLTACFLLLFIRCAFSQEAKFTVQQFTSIQGLPQNSVKSLDIDSIGFVWFTTEAGLVRYDGRHFRTYNHSDFSSINGDRFQLLFHDHLGNLSATNNSGSLILINNGQPKIVPNNKYPLNDHLYFTGGLPDYKIYYELTYNRLNKMKEWWYSFPSSIFPLNNNDFITTTRNSFLYYNRVKLKYTIPTNAYLPGNTFMIDSTVFFIDSKGYINKLNSLTRTYKKCTYVNEAGQVAAKFYAEKLLWNYPNEIAFCKRGNTLYELKRSVDGDTIFCKKLFNGLPENCKITAVVHQQSTGLYFVGTDTRGLFIFKPKRVLNLPIKGNGFAENNAYYSQVAIDDNHIFTTYGIVIGLDTTYTVEPRVFTVEGLLNANNGKLYFAKGDSIRYVFKGKQHNLNIKTGEAYCYLDEGDSIIAGTTKGFYSIKNDKIRLLKTITHDFTPIQMVRDNDQRLWVASCKGLINYSSNFSIRNTVKALNGICVRALYFYNGLLFVGTYGNGYYILKDNRLIKMPLDDNNYLAQIHSFYVDTKEQMWFSTNNGIFVASLKEIVRNFHTNQNDLYYYLINQDDGIKNPEFNGGCSPSVVRLKNGYLSYPSLEGLVWINPDKFNTLFPEDKLFFENIRINQDEIKQVNELRLPADFKVFSCELTIPYWGKPENLRIEYRLKGHSNSWGKIEPDEKRLRFTTLPSGDYILEVRIKNGFGSEDYFYNKLNFKVDEYFYEKTWVQFLGLLSILGLTLIGIRIYSNSIIRKNEQLEKSISKRTLELKESNELLHENLLKLQQSEEKLSAALTLRDKLMSIISHDLVTPIRFITLSSRLARSEADSNPKEELVQVLKEIETTTMRLHDNAQNVLHWIRFQSKGMQSFKSNVAIHDLVDEVVSLYQPIAEAGGSVINNLTPEEDIIITDPRILKIVIQNVLNNAVKFTKHGKISISSSIHNRDFHLLISDSGPGFSESALENIRQLRNSLNFSAFLVNLTEEGTQLGYQIIIELLRFLNGDFRIHSTKDKGSSIEIILYNCLQE